MKYKIISLYRRIKKENKIKILKARNHREYLKGKNTISIVKKFYPFIVNNQY
jgi:hypothetical protein